MDRLVYLHPIAMAFVIVLGVLVLREGLGMRNSRIARAAKARTGEGKMAASSARGRARTYAEMSARHRRLAKVFVPLMVLGWASGVASMVLLRNQRMFESIHWPFGTSAIVLLVIGGAIGLRMQSGRSLDQRTAHGLFGAGGLLLALGAAIAGMGILP